MANPIVKDMVREFLEREGYAGLFNENGDCACLARFLAPCDQMSEECEAGYFEECPADCGEHDFHICRSIGGESEGLF